MIRHLFLASLLACTLACRTDSQEVEEPEAAPVCICGTPEADFHGCYCELCLSGEGNPENALCTCSPLRIENEDEE